MGSKEKNHVHTWKINLETEPTEKLCDLNGDCYEILGSSYIEAACKCGRWMGQNMLEIYLNKLERKE